MEAAIAITDEALLKLEGGRLAESYQKYLPALKRTLQDHPELRDHFEEQS